MKKIFALICVLTLLTLCGCETFRGLGQDVQKAGGWVEDQAN
jgi:predicted small secreted protein